MRKFYYRSFITTKLRVTERGYYNDPPVVPPPPPPPVDDNAKKVDLTQEQLNNLLAAERRKAADTSKKTVEELEKMKTTAGMSQAQVETLQAQIGELEKTYMSQAELAKREAEKKDKEYATKLAETTELAKRNEQRFVKVLVDNAITQASAANDAYRAEQMLTQLGGKAKVVPIVVDGKPTEDFEVRIAFPDTTKEGVPVVLDLTPDAAMKRMKELPDLYGNFFKSGVSGGIGGNNQGNGGGGGPTDLTTATADPATYRANRKNLLK